jgi:hypothetical protein
MPLLVHQRPDRHARAHDASAAVAGLADAERGDARRRHPRPDPAADLPSRSGLVGTGSSDVPAGTRTRRLDRCLAEYGIAEGERTGASGPATTVTRAQFASFVARVVDAAGLLTGRRARRVRRRRRFGPRGGDRRAGSPRDRPGDADRRFRPDAPVRRDQLASMMVRTHEVLTGAPREPSRSVVPGHGRGRSTSEPSTRPATWVPCGVSNGGASPRRRRLVAIMWRASSHGCWTRWHETGWRCRAEGTR